jgi:hypothetical protein
MFKKNRIKKGSPFGIFRFNLVSIETNTDLNITLVNVFCG